MQKPIYVVGKIWSIFDMVDFYIAHYTKPTIFGPSEFDHMPRGPARARPWAGPGPARRLRVGGPHMVDFWCSIYSQSYILEFRKNRPYRNRLYLDHWYVSLSPSRLNAEAGGVHKISGLASAATCFVWIVVGSTLTAYVPKFVVLGPLGEACFADFNLGPDCFYNKYEIVYGCQLNVHHI